MLKTASESESVVANGDFHFLRKRRGEFIGWGVTYEGRVLTWPVATTGQVTDHGSVAEAEGVWDAALRHCKPEDLSVDMYARIQTYLGHIE